MGLSPWRPVISRSTPADSSHTNSGAAWTCCQDWTPAFSLPPEKPSPATLALPRNPASASPVTGMDWELEPSQAKGPSQVRGRGRPGVLGSGERTPLGEELGPGEGWGRVGSTVTQPLLVSPRPGRARAL